MPPKIIPISAVDPEAEAEERRLSLAPQELARQLSGAAKPVLIDVRSETEFSMLRLEGARLATRELVEEIFAKWAKDTVIVVYDHRGPTGLDAAKALASQGFTAAKCLAGGIDAWSREVDPLIPRY